ACLGQRPDCVWRMKQCPGAAASACDEPQISHLQPHTMTPGSGNLFFHERHQMIKEVYFRRFKQFREPTIKLHTGITLLYRGNYAGKSSLLHGLAVWEFCRTAMLMERGPNGLLAEATSKQGFGLGDDEFSPINVPSLKHLWTNLKTQK